MWLPSSYIYKKTKSRFYKTMEYILLSIMIITTLPLHAESNAEKTHETHKLNGIPEDNRKMQMGWHDFYVLPYFYVQVGTGVSSTYGIAEKNSSITNSYMPTFMIGIGFQQQYYSNGINFGYKIKLDYEIGVKALGENTMAFRSGGGFLQIHLGYKYILPYASFGYEIMSVSNNFIPTANETILYSDKGVASGFGFTILLSRYHAIEIETRWSKIYQYLPRLLFTYEFRF